MIKLRRILFLLFAATYLIVAPLTVLYALGYIFNPVQQTIFQTGLVSLRSEPERAKVVIDGIPLKGKTPLVLRDLKPGVYEVRVALRGHHPWVRQIEVKPERALRLENILLFPLSFKPEILGDFSISKMVSAPGGKSLWVLKGGEASDLYHFDSLEEKFRPVFWRPSPPEGRVEKVLFHPTGSRVLVLLRKGSLLEPMAVELTETFQVTNLTDLLTEPFEELRWSPTQKDSLFYLRGDTLRRLDIDRGLLFAALAREVLGYVPHEGRLFVLDRRHRFFELTEKGKVRKVLLDDPAKARQIFSPGMERYSLLFLPGPSVFFSSRDAFALFLSEKGRLLSNKLPYFLDEGVDEQSPAVSHPRAAYRKGEELWLVDFEREEEGVFFESGPSPRRVYKGKEPLSQIIWFYDDRYLLFLEGNQVKVQDFEGESEAVALFKISSRVREIAFEAKRGFLYFAHPDGDRPARVKLFEEPGLLLRLGETS